MVRRGRRFESVRGLCRIPAHGGFVSDQLAGSRTWARYGALYGAFRSKTPSSQATSLTEKRVRAIRTASGKLASTGAASSSPGTWFPGTSEAVDQIWTGHFAATVCGDSKICLNVASSIALRVAARTRSWTRARGAAMSFAASGGSGSPCGCSGASSAIASLRGDERVGAGAGAEVEHPLAGREPTELPRVRDAGERADGGLVHVRELGRVAEVFGPGSAGRADEVLLRLLRDGRIRLLDLALQA